MAYTTTTGSKYLQGRDTATIAALVRDEIKAAVKSHALPAATYSVRTSRYSMGSSITVQIRNVKDPAFRLYSEARMIADRDRPHDHNGIPWMDERASAIIDAVEAMLAAYNRSTVESQSDYYDHKFHAHVTFEAGYSNDRREIELALLPSVDEIFWEDGRPHRKLTQAEYERACCEPLDTIPCPAPALASYVNMTDEEDARLEALNAAERAELREHPVTECESERLFGGGFAEGDYV